MTNELQNEKNISRSNTENAREINRRKTSSQEETSVFINLMSYTALVSMSKLQISVT